MEDKKHAQEVRDKGARFLMIGACLVVLVAGLKAASPLIVPLLAAIFLSILSLPLLTWLQNRRIPTGIAVLITILVALGSSRNRSAYPPGRGRNAIAKSGCPSPGPRADSW